MKLRRLSLLMVFSCLLLSCSQYSNTEVEDDVKSKGRQYTPISIQSMDYTSPVELYSLYTADPTNVIHYKVARLLASAELLAGANYGLGEGVNPYDEWYLTELPKVVYNYNNTPKYYEFGYVCNGQIVATVTTYAQKEIAGVIAFLFQDPLDYNCQMLDYYVGNYPHRYYGMNGVCFLQDCNEEIEGGLDTIVSTDEEEMYLMLQLMESGDLDAIQQDMSELDESIDEYIAERDEYWQLIDAYVENNLQDLINEIEPDPGENLNLSDIMSGETESVTESEIDYIRELIALLDYTLGYFDVYTIPEYDNPQLQATHWQGYCGPAACAWVYRGKYNNFNGYYLPLYPDVDFSFFEINATNHYAYYRYSDVANNYSLGLFTSLYNFTTRSNEADNGLTACFYNETVPFTAQGVWHFPLYHGGLNRGFDTATNGTYHVKFTCKPYDWIIGNHPSSGNISEPVIIAVYCSHYIVAFGTGATLKNDGSVKDRYFMVTDNGYTISEHNYHPYMRRYSFWNLHYGLTTL